MPDATTSIAPIVKTVTVGVSPEAAYRLFTDGWENSEAGQARRNNYDSGWDVVLGAYVRGTTPTQA